MKNAQKTLTSKVNRILHRGIEKKYFDASVNPAVYANGTFVSFCGGIQTGTTNTTRIGNRVHIYRIEVTGKVSNGLATDSINDYQLWYNRNPEGLLPPANQVYKSDINAIMGSPRNVDYLKEYSLICHKLIETSPIIAGQQYITTNTKYFTIYKKVSIDVQYTASTGAVSDVLKGDVVLFNMCISPISGNINVRLWYTDI